MASRKSGNKLQLLEYETLTSITPIPAWEEMAPDHFSMEDVRPTQGTAKSYSSVVPKNEGGDEEPPSTSAWEGDNYIPGTIFNDNLVGGSGNDDIYGNHGHDKISGAGGDDWIKGGTGNDKIYGGNGNDYLFGDNYYNPYSVTDGADTIYGGIGDDYIAGEKGNNLLYGDEGNDTLFGGFGYDNDTLGGGNDTLFGGSGNDAMWGGGGDDQLSGGIGNDLFVFDVSGPLGHDTIVDFGPLNLAGQDRVRFFNVGDVDGIPGVDYRDLDLYLDVDGDGAVTAADGTIVNGGAGGDITFHFTKDNADLTLTFTGYGQGAAGSFAVDSLSDVCNPNHIWVG